MGTNNNILKQYSVQNYAGPISELPNKLPFGDYYFAEDVGILYKYNYQGVPISISGAGGGVTYQRATSYSTLSSGVSVGDLAFVDSSEGTQWLPGSVGGSYYPSGWYLWNGTTWLSDNNAIANQFETNINSLNTKVDKVVGKELSENDLTDSLKSTYDTNTTWRTTNGDNLINHLTDTSNPHGVDKAQVGLGNVDNTSDLLKPLSNATTLALNSKVDVVSGERLINALEITKLGNQAGINTGDQDISILGQTLSISGGSSVTIPDNNTQLSQSDIEAMGFSTTDNVLTDADIAAMGYVKTDNDTQLSDADIEALGYLKTPSVLPLAKGGALNLQQELLAKDAQPALTVLAVASTNTGRVQGCSLGDGNVVEVYASGDDYNNSIVLYREFMQAGEPICFTGLSNGAIITSTQGFYGVSEQVSGSHESPMPLMSLGLAFQDTFVYAFRNSEQPNGDNRGEIYIIAGPLPVEVTLTRNGIVVLSQENIALEPFERLVLATDANSEYRIQATSPVMGAVQARMNVSSPRFYDARLVMPTTNDGITWPRSGNVSAPYDNTEVDYYVRDGASGDFVVSPGAFIDFDGSAGTGADDTDYEPAGATRVLAKGLISAYSGADSAGLEASPLMPTSAMSQVVAQPFFIDDSGDGGNSGIAIASPYEGTAKVYEWNSATGVADLAYTLPLTRGVDGAGITLTTPLDQNFPASGIIANEPGLSTDASVIQLNGDLGAGYIVADVPITVVVQNASPTHTPSVRSQGGATTTSLISDDDETLSLGMTPSNIKAELTKDASNFLRRRVIDSSGIVSYVLV